MSLTSLLPIRISLRDKPTGKRREDDGVDLLQCKLAGAQLLIKGLRLQLDDKDREHEETVRRIDDRYTETIRGLEGIIAGLQHRLGIACKANAAADQTQEIDPEEVRRNCIKPVPLHQSPMARREPDHVPGWVKDEGAA